MLPLNPSQPYTSEDIHEIYQEIRNTRTAFKDLYQNGHYFDGELDLAKAGADGYHKPLVLKEYYAEDWAGNPFLIPEHVVDSAELFTKKINGLDEFCVQGNGGAYQFTEDTFPAFSIETSNNIVTEVLKFCGFYFSKSSSGEIIKSEDGGVTWSAIATNAGNYGVSVANNVLIFGGIRSGTAGTYKSTDGINFTLVYSYFSSKKCYFINGKYINFALEYGQYGTTRLHYSDDLITWNYDGGGGDIVFGDTASNIKVFFVGGYYYFTSSSGTKKYSSSFVAQTYSSIISGNVITFKDKYYALMLISTGGSNSKLVIKSTSDFETIDEIIIRTGTAYNQLSMPGQMTVANNKLYFDVSDTGTGRTYLYESEDGINFSSIYDGANNTNELKGTSFTTYWRDFYFNFRGGWKMYFSKTLNFVKNMEISASSSSGIVTILDNKIFISNKIIIPYKEIT